VIELLFSDSGAGSLICAQKQENGGAKDEAHGTTITAPGGESALKSTPADVVRMALNADIGDISDLANWRARMRQLGAIAAESPGADEEQTEREARQAGEAVSRLHNAAGTGEPIRIWWSDVPKEACGYYWALHLLKDAAGPVTAVKLPLFCPTGDGDHLCSCSGTGQLNPAQFLLLLPSEQRVEQAERQGIAVEWQRLKAENAPLRAVVNGRVASVPADFYDYVLRRVLSPTPCQAAVVIGRALAEGPGGVSDWWYAGRLRQMITTGEVAIAAAHETFYRSALRRG
jgi:hypothetical protein